MRVNAAIAGTGKSTKIRERMETSKKSFLVAVPTIELNAEYERCLPDVIDRIDSKVQNTDKKIISEILESIASSGHMGITHTSLLSVLQKDHPKGWFEKHLIIDEILSSRIQHYSYDLSSLSTIVNLIHVVEHPNNQDIFILNLNDFLAVDCLLSGGIKDDSIGKVATSILRTLSDPSYLHVTSKKLWNDFRFDIDNFSAGRLVFTSLLHADCFNSFSSVEILAADFFRSEMCLALKFQEVKFQDITHDQRQTHPNSKLITINYFSERNWSKGLRDKEDSDETTNSKKIANFFMKQIGSRKFIWNANLDDRKDLESVFKQEALTAVHGVNAYSDYTVAIFMPSRNLSPEFTDLTQQIGIPVDKINFARTQLAAYQFVMRLAIRKRNNTKPCDLYVMDKQTADFLITRFPDAKVIKHSIDLIESDIQNVGGRPKGITNQSYGKYEEAKRLMSQGSKKLEALKAADISRGTFDKIDKTE